MIIYKTINLINDKFYVGKHYTSADDGYLGSGTIIKKSIKKHNKDNFKREILEFVNENNINDREVYWIAQLSATDRNIGYNITSGGDNGPIMWGENNPSWGRCGIKHPLYGKPLTYGAKQLLSNFHKGKKLSKNTKNKMSKAKKGEHNPNWGKTTNRKTIIKIINNNKNSKQILINNIEYISIGEASRILNIRASTLSYRLKSKTFIKYQYIQRKEH